MEAAAGWLNQPDGGTVEEVVAEAGDRHQGVAVTVAAEADDVGTETAPVPVDSHQGVATTVPADGDGVEGRYHEACARGALRVSKPAKRDRVNNQRGKRKAKQMTSLSKLCIQA